MSDERPYNDVRESIPWLDTPVEIEGCRMLVGYEREEQQEEAQEFAELCVYSWALRHRMSINLIEVTTKTWTADGKGVSTAELSDKVQFSGRLVATHTRMAGASVALSTEIDTASFVKDAETARKALACPPLRTALRYFSEEVVGSERPLYGVYKALEVLCLDLGVGKIEVGKTALAALVGEHKNYVADVMETTQLQRHALTAARQRCTENDCRERAARLIGAYAETRKIEDSAN